MFYGRTEELNLLEKRYQKGKFECIVIYGRRRVGKTELIKEFSKKETKKLWPEILRFENPHTYYVDLSQNLWSLKQSLLHKYTDSYEN